MKAVVVIFSTLFLLSACSVAEKNESLAGQSNETKASEKREDIAKAEKVCDRAKQKTGSRLRKRKC
ncbi:hypothetical protein [Pleionea sp. CnH1-48]|uniref:hypothetical protein n=1 Tax=Pleionea sp. CnH1-48 TaxID=2954494 RepID=UPI0020971CF5|nr:hypothetical protein [Pleionea sp. CnH1-48]MCO7224909.1 hypothetical protein [Pleionea sp. CnH1-48]